MTVTFPPDLAESIHKAAEATHESAATVIRQAVRAGLETSSRAHINEAELRDYYANYPRERAELEEAAMKVDMGSEERD